MAISVEALECEVLKLPTHERVRLLDRVVASLDQDRERDEAWDTLAARRDHEIETDLASEVSVTEVLSRLRAELP